MTKFITTGVIQHTIQAGRAADRVAGTPAIKPKVKEIPAGTILDLDEDSDLYKELAAARVLRTPEPDEIKRRNGEARAVINPELQPLVDPDAAREAAERQMQALKQSGVATSAGGVVDTEETQEVVTPSPNTGKATTKTVPASGKGSRKAPKAKDGEGETKPPVTEGTETNVDPTSLI